MRSGDAETMRRAFEKHIYDQMPAMMALLIVVFGMRLAKTRKFMPAGLMLALTGLALVARLLLSTPGA